MQKNKRIYFIAGERSGDLHGSSLIRALKGVDRSLECVGVGGDLMCKEGFETLLPFRDFEVMGFSDVLRVYPLLRRHFYFLAQRILKENPEAVVMIDYPGFNLRLAQFLRKGGYFGKLIYYIAPTVWAWKKKRIDLMAESLDLLLTIFPFEPAYFSKTSLKTLFVGNPLRQQIEISQGKGDWQDALDLPTDRPLLALFPGSRPAEIKHHLPLFIETAKSFSKNSHALAISIAHRDLTLPIFNLLEGRGLKKGVDYWFVPGNCRYELMKESKVALAKSGTVALELALLGCPSVIAYHLSFLNFLLAKWFFRIRLPYYALPNILLNEAVFPEFYGFKLDPLQLAEALKLQSLKHPFMLGKKRELENVLTEKNASQEAAKEILQII